MSPDEKPTSTRSRIGWAALIGAVSDGSVPPSIAMEMALVGRFFERLGDHAVNVADRVRYLVIG